MLISAIILFALAAVLGLYLLSYVLRNKNTPKGLAFTHGPLAVLGLIVLLIYAFVHRPAPIISIMLFVFAVLGGLVLIYRDITGKSVPKWMAMVHGAMAIIALVFLVLFAFVAW